MIHILLVEDSPTDAQIIQSIFEHADKAEWQVTHVERLSKAIEICSFKSVFDVVLLDLRLPDSAGLETVTSFRSHIANIPIVVLTKTNDEELGLKAMVEGAQDYLIKDEITISRLVRAVRYAIERGLILKQLHESETNIREAFLKEKESNNMKSQFIAMISHEFRTPMSTIRASVDLLQAYPDEIASEQNAKYLKRIENAIEQMLKLLDEILFLSRNECGRVKLCPRPIDLDIFCQEIVDVMQLSMGEEHNLIFTSSGDYSQAGMDEELLSCILTNLLSNAIKYSPKNSNIYLNLSSHNHTVIFEIQDEGIGIPEKDQIHLFENFYRASNVRGIQGTGLGLAIVKRCVELHLGSITIDSQVGAGTTVTVTLPLTPHTHEQ
ncbi:MAG: response regulator [Calothrix sp. C42_A2020_038]|nr:response regulator [Calothrix sp. C42_A2020_038]